MARSKIDGFDVSPVTRDRRIAAQGPARQEASRDVIKPEALTRVREVVAWGSQLHCKRIIVKIASKHRFRD